MAQPEHEASVQAFLQMAFPAARITVRSPGNPGVLFSIVDGYDERTLSITQRVLDMIPASQLGGVLRAWGVADKLRHQTLVVVTEPGRVD